MNTLLVRPNCSEGYQSAVQGLRSCEMPVWLMMMANLYKNVFILDCEAKNYDFLQSKTTICSYIKNFDVTKVVFLCTGSHPSANIQQTEIALMLKDGIEDKVEIEVYDWLNFNPCDMQLPRYDLVNMNAYRPHNWHRWSAKERNINKPVTIEDRVSDRDNSYGSIFSSISCPMNCSFCQVADFYRSKYKKRDTTTFLQDIYTQYSVYDITNFKMMDELFALPNEHVRDICLELAKTIGSEINIWAYARIDTVNEGLLKLLRSAGVRWLAYGIESGSQAIRQSVDKGSFTNNKIAEVVKMTKDCGINVLGNYMFGFWDDTLDTMNETLDFAIKLNCEYSNFYATVAYPGSKLYDEMKAKNVVLPTNYRQYAQMSKEFIPLSTATLSSKEVLQFRDEAFNIYHSNSNYLSMMKSKFSVDVMKEILTMTCTKIERELLK